MTDHHDADARRDAALDAYDVLDGPPRPELRALVELAAQVAGVPYAAVNLLSSHSQHQVATVGFDGEVSRREDSMCWPVVTSGQPVMIPDVGADSRYADNPCTTGGLAPVKFYGAHPLCTRAGVVIGTLCVFDDEAHPVTPEAASGLALLADRVVDVLELELATRQLSEANERLARADVQLEAFAGQVSHDLKNPLTSLSLSLDMLEIEVDEDSDSQVTIARAQRASVRMDGLIAHLQEFAGTGGRRQEPVDLGVEVAAVIDDMAAWLDTADVTIGDLPRVTGDRSQLRSVLHNLIHNAAKFTDPGQPPAITVSSVDSADGHRIEVADRGPGVPAEHREHVFAPLARLNRKIPGFGIGLVTSRRIVEAHGGSIGVEPREGGGSVFWLVLPPATAG